MTALDWPAVLAIAQKTAADAGLQERFTTIAGDYHKVALPEAAFDLAILANVTHLETAAGNRGLFERLRRALRRGGEIAVIDVFPIQPAGALPAALYELGLALRTAGGRVHRAADLAGLAGRRRLRREPLHSPRCAALYHGNVAYSRKPALQQLKSAKPIEFLGFRVEFRT